VDIGVGVLGFDYRYHGLVMKHWNGGEIMIDQSGFYWSDGDETSLLLSIIGPDKSGWHTATIEVTGDPSIGQDGAQQLLKTMSYKRPRKNKWKWEQIDTTYMRKSTTYYEVKLRRDGNE
tara:strand:- start:45 stop:401 length:357 start_codon:yes stop_codon:yes gene_type:complete